MLGKPPMWFGGFEQGGKLCLWITKKPVGAYTLSFTVAHFGEYNIQLNEVLTLCKKKFDDMLDW